MPVCNKTTVIDMPSHQPDDLLLLIRCPSCGQRFKVGEDLREKTVECGGCEHRFRINDEVIVRGKKFYPGERNNSGLNRFQRVPLSIAPAAMGQQPTMRYGETPDPALLEPASPLRILAGMVGVAGIILMALLLMFGASRGGVLDGMALENRLVMGGFASIMGIALLIYANPKARLKAVSVGLLLSAGLLTVPFVFTVGSKTVGDREDTLAGLTVPKPPVDEAPKSDPAATLKARVGTDPLVKEIKRLEAEGSKKHAMGLWLRGLSEMNRFLVRDYVFRVTGADPSSHFYPRDGGDFLMVVIGPKQSLEEMADVTSALGHTEKIYPELSVIEVRVNNENFTEGPLEKLSKKDDPAFYDLNKRELECIDLERVKRAVQRLAEAEPKIYRSDISRKLISLLKEEGIDFKGNICRALASWSETPGPAGDVAVQEVQQLMEKKAVVPPEMIALIVKEKNTAVIPYLDQLWFKDATTWESLYGELGRAIEATVIQRFPNTEGPVRYSAVRLLGKVGGSDSLAVLGTVSAGANPELKVLLEQAQKSIHERLARQDP
ncbi:MAG: hypothetical protein ABIT37_18580 [Luteolibacter sp.]